MRPWQWEPAPRYTPPTLWHDVKATAPFWVPLLLITIADILGF
jgi:hypothetical protein